MQCQQPLFGISLPCPSQYFPSNPVNPFNSCAPDVIGEGEVNSITFPDGSIQYYFLPVRWQSDIYLKRCPPHPFHDNMFCNYNKSNTGVWIIRNFTNTISPVYNQYWQRANLDTFPKQCFSCDCNVVPAGFPLKFHNDRWTSTTDLHCFCPYLPPAPETTATRTTAAQVETPRETKCSCQTTRCDDPCRAADCMHHILKEYKNIINLCKCKKLEMNTSSHMSIDKSKTSISSSKTSPSSSNTSMKRSKYGKNKHKKPSSVRNSRKKGTKSDICCNCDFHSSANKVDDMNKNQKRQIEKLIKPEKHKHASEKHKQPAETSSELIPKGAVHNTGEAGGQNLTPKSTEETCNCKVQGKSNVDKVVTTYNDQASSVKEEEGQTQTENMLVYSLSTTDTKGKESRDKRRKSSRLSGQHRRKAAQSSDKLTGVYAASSSESLCSSYRYDTSRESIN